MLVLALDSSQIRGAVVLFEHSPNGKAEILAEAVGSTSVVHSEGLLSLIDGVLAKAGKRITDVECFGCGVGPGSFTGIRVGLATVKGLAQVTGKKIVPFSSIRALALSREQSDDSAPVAVNAYQGMVFSGRMKEGKWEDFTCRPEDLGVQPTQAQVEPHGLVAAWQESAAAATSYLNIHANYIRLSAAEEKLIKS